MHAQITKTMSEKLTKMVPTWSQNLSQIEPGGALEATWEPPLKQGASKTSFLMSLSAFRGSPETPEMLCGLRLQGPLLMHPAVALGSALTARGPSGGPFRALPGAHWAGPLGPPWVGPFGPKSSSRILTSSFFIVKRSRGKAIGRFWALLPNWFSGYLCQTGGSL